MRMKVSAGVGTLPRDSAVTEDRAAGRTAATIAKLETRVHKNVSDHSHTGATPGLREGYRSSLVLPGLCVGKAEHVGHLPQLKNQFLQSSQRWSAQGHDVLEQGFWCSDPRAQTMQSPQCRLPAADICPSTAHKSCLDAFFKVKLTALPANLLASICILHLFVCGWILSSTLTFEGSPTMNNQET